MLNEFSSQLTARGYKGCVVPIEHLNDLQREIESHINQKHIDKELYRAYLAEFNYSPPDTLPDAASIILVAVPEPKIRITFSWNGEPVQVFVPPTYGERKKDKIGREFLRQILKPEGYRVAEAKLPKKLIAVRCGLAAYGKNNITYVPGMGSFYGLMAVYSDLPPDNGTWQESEMMEHCKKCSACIKRCPSGAIDPDRFLLHAERCITFHNEKPGHVPFASWINPSWHNCLVGCLHCQRVCPENKSNWKWEGEAAEFSEEETALLLEGLPADRLPAESVEKLERLDIESFVDLIPRNLKALIKQLR
jgi:epoxyqueuosine reductase